MNKGINLFTSFNSSESLEKNGVPIHFGQNANGEMTTIMVRRAGGSNTAFTKRYEALTKPYRRQIQLGAMEDSVMKGIMHRLYAETVVAGWSGVLTRDNSEELPFTVDNCIELFKSAEAVFGEVVDVSVNAAVYRDEVREEDAKN
jgi:hypothetical protein